MAEANIIFDINWEESEEICQCSFCGDLTLNGSNHLFLNNDITGTVMCNDCFAYMTNEDNGI